MICLRTKYIVIIILLSIGYIIPSINLSAQEASHSLCFISDCQLPLLVEKIFLKPYKNKEGRDSLFREIEKENQGSVFMLGDIVGIGSESDKWKDVDDFLKTLHSKGKIVYAIPGNHEYLLKASAGISQYQVRFPVLPLTGYCVRTDSIAIVMLNSNFKHLSVKVNDEQQRWYLSVLDSLDSDESVKSIIVCTHYSPYSNSKVVGSSVPVQNSFVPRFECSAKAKLFISGHSHNLEYFEDGKGRHYLVIGGGGGIAQPLYTGSAEKYHDLIRQDDKPLFFYVVLQRKGSTMEIIIRGYSRDMRRTTDLKIPL